MFDTLGQYRQNGFFTFESPKSLSQVCNAPKEASGVYLVNGRTEEKRELLYIGSSGKMQQDGTLKGRQGGMYDRIVNGKQFDKPRRESWLQKMNELGIQSLEVRWYVTFDLTVKHIPVFVEGRLIQEYFEKHACLPLWNSEF